MHTRWGNFGEAHWGHAPTFVALSLWVARRISRLDLDFFRRGTGMVTSKNLKK